MIARAGRRRLGFLPGISTRSVRRSAMGCRPSRSSGPRRLASILVGSPSIIFHSAGQCSTGISRPFATRWRGSPSAAKTTSTHQRNTLSTGYGKRPSRRAEAYGPAKQAMVSCSLVRNREPRRLPTLRSAISSIRSSTPTSLRCGPVASRGFRLANALCCRQPRRGPGLRRYRTAPNCRPLHYFRTHRVRAVARGAHRHI